jgi:hypothetical protein
MTKPRRFPVPWTFEDHNDACFIVMDTSGLPVAYVYYEEGGPANGGQSHDPRRSAADRGQHHQVAEPPSQAKGRRSLAVSGMGHLRTL